MRKHQCPDEKKLLFAVAQLEYRVFRNKIALNAEILNWRTLLARIKDEKARAY
jgi:hypothetical protein